MYTSRFLLTSELGELTNLGAGLGFNGYDKDGNDKWDLLTNVKIWQLEVRSEGNREINNVFEFNFCSLIINNAAKYVLYSMLKHKLHYWISGLECCNSISWRL